MYLNGTTSKPEGSHSLCKTQHSDGICSTNSLEITGKFFFKVQINSLMITRVVNKNAYEWNYVEVKKRHIPCIMHN